MVGVTAWLRGLGGWNGRRRMDPIWLAQGKSDAPESVLAPEVDPAVYNETVSDSEVT